LDTSPKLTPDEACKFYAKFLQVPDSIPLDFLHGMVISEIEKISGSDTIYNARLCFKIDLLDSRVRNVQTGYVDAQTGEVVKMTKRFDNYSATGSFSTLYSNTKSAGTQYYNNAFNLCDSSRGAAIHTWDLNNTYYAYYSSNRVEFTDSNTSWTAEEHSANNDRMALDIHWALQEIYDYFNEDPYEFQSFDGNNHNIDAYVHCYFPIYDANYNIVGYTKDNAYHSLIGDYEAFYFGDGESSFKPLGALDVVAHEYGHAITYNSTGLNNIYEVQKSMNEGFSDIWGAAIENAVTPLKDCWKMGEEVINVSGYDCLRDLENPGSSSAYMKIAETYADDLYNDGGSDGAYEKSGVMSHWFYLLAEGGSGTNNNDDDYTVYGLGIEEAAKIVFEGQTGHFGSIASYSEARTAMVDASNVLYGENSMQSLQVANAWYAVGVGSNPGQVSISGSDLVCYSGTMFTANNAPTGSTISWSTSSDLEVYSGGNTTTPTIKAKYETSNLYGWVQPSFTSDGSTLEGPSKVVWVGPPYVNPASIEFSCVDGSGFCCTNAFGNEFSFEYAGSYNYFDIKITNMAETQTLREFTTYSTTDYINLFSPPEGTYKFWVRGNNGCGTAANWSKTTVDYMDCGHELLALEFTPNPATSQTTIKIVTKDERILSSNDDEDWKLEVYTQNQLLKFIKSNIKGSEYILNTSGWADGAYYVRLDNKKEVLTGILIVKNQP